MKIITAPGTVPWTLNELWIKRRNWFCSLLNFYFLEKHYNFILTNGEMTFFSVVYTFTYFNSKWLVQEDVGFHNFLFLRFSTSVNLFYIMFFEIFLLSKQYISFFLCYGILFCFRSPEKWRVIWLNHYDQSKKILLYHRCNVIEEEIFQYLLISKAPIYSKLKLKSTRFAAL